MNRHIQLLILLLISVQTVVTAQLPNSQVYMFSFTQTGDKFNMRDFKYLSGFNPNGYNNQPYFVSNDKLWMVTNYYDKESNEIIELDLFDQKLYRITETPEAEYSPSYIPSNKYFSCVRVDKDGNQNLWAYPKNRNNTGVNLLEGDNKVGYYSWLNQDEVAVFKLGPPVHLSIESKESDEGIHLIDDIGRCLKSNSKGLLYFVHKMNDEFWFIKSYDKESGAIETVVQTYGKVEDFEILKDDSVIMASGTTMYRYDPSNNKAWVEIADLRKYGFTNITRIATRHNKIVFVNEK